MDIFELMRSRHSVRQYLDKAIPADVRAELDTYAKQLNAESGLNMQIIYDEPNCFNSRMAHYGNFENCTNYISVVGKKTSDGAVLGGYYGEKLVLKAQQLGLNTCWVALSHGKTAAKVNSTEKEIIVIALGYGKTQGKDRKSKSLAEVSDYTPDAPEWYKRGIEAALLAPTAINQQKFFITRDGNKVGIKTAVLGPCLKIDQGIVKCHFELGAEKDNFEWKK